MATTQERREVAGFDEVRLEGTGIIIIEQGETDSLIIEADSDLLPRLKSEVDQGRLILGLKHWYDVLFPVGSRDITYHITLRELHGVSISGSGKLRCGPLTTDHLKLVISGMSEMEIAELHAGDLELGISGTGEIDLKGAAPSLEARISGSGKVRAAGLECQKARLHISGSGSVQVNVTETLSVHISGSGDVRYQGQPQIEQRISGSGRIQPL